MDNSKKLLGGIGIGCCLMAFFPFILGGVILFAFLANGGTQQNAQTDAITASACGYANLDGAKRIIPSLTGKLGHEQHLSVPASCISGPHFVGLNSEPLGNAGGCGSISPHTTDQEHWYFNTRWNGFNWSTGTITNATVWNSWPHKRIIIRSKESGLSMVVSAEEYGPNPYVTTRDGIWYGAPPEVYRYLKTGNPYDGNPSSTAGQIEILGTVSGSTPLGPCT